MAKDRSRANGEGTIYRRKGGWCAQYVIQTPEGPKRRSIYGKKREEVAAKLAEAISGRGKGFVFDAGNLTVGEYLDDWLGGVRGTIRQTSYARYEQIVRDHIGPTLGSLKLKAITPAHCRVLYHQKLDSGLSPRTVQYVHVTLHKALKDAVSDGLIPRNVTDGVKAPRKVKTEMRPLSPGKTHTLLQAAKGDRFEAIYVLAITTGMRQGELLGLRWEDIDLERGVLSVRRSLSSTKDGPVFAAPKTPKSRRQIRLIPRAVAALEEHRTRQERDRASSNGTWHEQGLVFANCSGGPLHPRFLHSKFKGLLKRAGLPEIRFHDLRHTCATLLFCAGTHPKIVQELLGHSSITMTLDTYSHVLPSMGDVAASAMDEVLEDGDGVK